MAGYDGAFEVTKERTPFSLFLPPNSLNVAVGIASFSPSHPSSTQSKKPMLFAGGAVFYNDQDYQWNDDGGAALPGAPRGQFSKQAARGKFFAMLSKQRRGGARAGDGVEIIG